MGTNVKRDNLRRIHKDRMRPLRVVEYLDNSAVFEKSPIEIKDEYVISDRDTGELFLTVLFRSVSQKRITALEINVLLFKERSVVPEKKIPFSYSVELGTFGERISNGTVLTDKYCKAHPAVDTGEIFGQGVYLPLPDTYFKKLRIELVRVAYADGTEEELKLISGARASRFEELDLNSRAAYSKVNIFIEAEQKHPICVLPERGENVWLCCCGHKNPSDLAYCETCGRDRDWQMEHLRGDALSKSAEELYRAPEERLEFDKTHYNNDRVTVSKEQQLQKEEQCHQVLQRLAAQERERERQKNLILPRLLLIALALLALIFVIRFVDNLLSAERSSGASSGTAPTTQQAADGD